jgi:hypothetical protein
MTVSAEPDAGSISAIVVSHNDCQPRTGPLRSSNSMTLVELSSSTANANLQ